MNPNNPKEYRTKLGFNSQKATKEFLGAKDIKPKIDRDYAQVLCDRVENTVRLLLNIPSISAYFSNQDNFIDHHVRIPFNQLISNDELITKLNNQGRRVENVLFSWLRGYAICTLFQPLISQIFGVDQKNITQVGKDDINNPKEFSRKATADLLVQRGNRSFRLEFQAGFQNDATDIKESKITEAQRTWHEESIPTICMHVDTFNGKVAFIRLDAIDMSNRKFEIRQQFESAKVTPIEPKEFQWFLLSPSLPTEASLNLGL